MVCRWERGIGERGVGVSVQSMGEMGKNFCPNFLQPFLGKNGRRSCNDGSRELIPVFHNPHRQFRPFRSAVPRTLEYLGWLWWCSANGVIIGFLMIPQHISFPRLDWFFHKLNKNVAGKGLEEVRLRRAISSVTRAEGSIYWCD